MIRSVLAFGLAFAAFGAAHADTIVLKNGGEIKGTVLNPDEDPFYLKLPSGRISFYHREVKEIRFDGNKFDASSWTIPKDKRAGTSDSFEASDEDDLSSEVPMDDEQLRRVRRVLEELNELNNEDEDSGFGEERQNVVRSLARIGPGVAPYLETEMDKGNPENYRYLLIALARVNPARGAKHAQEVALTHRDPDVRHTAVSLLAKRNPDRHSDTLREACNDTQGPVRLAAIQGLARCTDDELASLFVNVLMDDPLPRVRDAARTALETTTGRQFKTDEEWLEWYSASLDSVEEHARLD